MSFKTDKKEKHAVVTSCVEKLDSSISPVLKAELVLLNSKGVKNIILDLSQTRYCDSSGLSAILVGNRLCKGANGSLVICGVQAMVMKLIAISQLDNILSITPTLSEAEDYIFMEEIERDVNKKE
jgi:anti-sigma B factor antagonist